MLVLKGLSPPVSTKDILELAFVEGVLPDMGACLDTKKKYQATQELWETPISLREWEVSFTGGFLLLVACA